MIACISGGCALPPEQPPQVDLPTYECRQADTPIQIDGILDDPAWDRAAVITKFYAHGDPHGTLRSRTEARLLWDEENLYVGFVAYDADICAWGEKRDGHIFYGDVVELFIKPHDDRPDYYEINVSPANVVFDAYYAYGYAGQHRFSKWNSSAVTAAKVYGTLDNWHDQDQKWQVEYRIPFATLPSLNGTVPQPGGRWRFHVARYNYSVYFEDRGPEGKVSSLSGQEFFSNTPLDKGFHQLDKFAFLLFTR